LDLENYQKAEESFWELITIIRRNEKKISKEILEKVEEILAQVRIVMSCYVGIVDYKSALSSLKKVLKANYGKFPKEIQEKINKAHEGSFYFLTIITNSPFILGARLWREGGVWEGELRRGLKKSGSFLSLF